jgi:hypothetical protein
MKLIDHNEPGTWWELHSQRKSRRGLNNLNELWQGRAEGFVFGLLSSVLVLLWGLGEWIEVIQ